MNYTKVALFAIAALLLGGALLYSLTLAKAEGEKLVVYDNFAYYEASAKTSGGEATFGLPYGVELDSITLRLAKGYVVSQHINEANSTSESDLLDLYVGKEVSIFDSDGKEVKGTLLKFDYGRAYVKTSEGLYIITPKSYLLPGFEGEVKDTNASVVFMLSSAQATDAKLSYLMDSISWNPDYTLYLNGDSGTLSLYGAVSNYAQDYENVSLSLFYGQVKRSSGRYYYPYYDYAAGARSKTAEASYSPDYEPSAVSEFYKFDLGNVDLKQGESKFNLLEKQISQIRKTYEMEITGYDYEAPRALATYLSVNNTAASGLGIALPAGNVRVMDAEGFVGEDYISETPKGEELRISIGNAFDVVGTSRIVNQSQETLVNCDPSIMEAMYAPICVNETGYIYATTYEYEATVKNKKASSADVVLAFSPYGEWTITEETLVHEKVSQNEVKWRLSVPAGSEKTLKFTIVVKTDSRYYHGYADAYSV